MLGRLLKVLRNYLIFFVVFSASIHQECYILYFFNSFFEIFKYLVIFRELCELRAEFLQLHVDRFQCG